MCFPKSATKPVFGVRLADSYRSSNYPYIPKIVVKCVEAIEQSKSIAQPGIYLKPLDDRCVQKLKQKVEAKYDYDFLKKENPDVVAALLMLFFKEMSTNLIPIDLLDFLAFSLDYDIYVVEDFTRIAKCMATLDDPNYHTLRFLLEHLQYVSQHSVHNMMSPPILATIWTDCLFARGSLGRTDEEIEKYHELLSTLIQHSHIIFN